MSLTPLYLSTTLPCMNPVTARRTELGLTQGELADAVDMSRDLVHRVEQGVLPNIPARILNFLWAVLADRLTANRAYAAFQLDTRINNFGALTPKFPHVPVGVHPFTYWREASDLSLIKFCKLFCVNSTALHRFESSKPYPYGGMQNLPSPLVTALEQSGYDLDPLREAWQRYRFPSKVKLSA